MAEILPKAIMREPEQLIQVVAVEAAGAVAQPEQPEVLVLLLLDTMLP
jgi:hypothetical protein